MNEERAARHGKPVRRANRETPEETAARKAQNRVKREARRKRERKAQREARIESMEGESMLVRRVRAGARATLLRVGKNHGARVQAQVRGNVAKGLRSVAKELAQLAGKLDR